jgi:hypothetical protein
MAIKFISCASTCHASSPLWLYPCMHPATGVPKQKNADFFLSHDVLGARRRGLGSGRPRTCTIPARACEDAVAVPRAATGGTCCADRFAAHTLRRQLRFKEKTPKSHSPGKCWFFLTALQLPSRPVHCWRAWLLSFGSFDAKSPSTIFWLAGQILVEKIETVFF